MTLSHSSAATDGEARCGDAIATLRSLPAECVDAVITSPPYYRRRDYGVAGQYGQESTVADYIATMGIVLTELFRVTKATGTCFLVVGDSSQHGKTLLVPHRLALLADQNGWVVRNDIIWCKKDPAPGKTYKRWRSGHEHILFLAKHAKTYCFNEEDIRVPYSQDTLRRWGAGQAYGGPKSEHRRNSSDTPVRHGRTFRLNPRGCIPTDVWTVSSSNNKARHYAAFPREIVEPIVKACTCPGDVVLDPFMGTGTVGVVAKTLGRRFLGIDLNPSYVSIAREALAAVDTP